MCIRDSASSATLTYRGGGTAVNKDTLQKVGGGVRIKTITKKNNTGEVLERTGYLYESENHKTSGILMFSVKQMCIRDSTYGRSHVNMSDGEIARKIDELFDLRPKAIEDRLDRKSTRLNSSHSDRSRMPSSA